MGKIADFFREQSIVLDGQKKTKMLSLDRQFEDMQAERDSLKAENLNLKAQVNPLQREVERLKNQVQTQGASVHGLEQSEIDMLIFIGNQKSSTSSDIAEGMGMHSVPVEHFLGRLLKKNYIVQQHVPMLGAMYSLDDKGNAYLVDNKLVPVTTNAAEQPSNPNGYACDHCGSTKLKRIGNRPDPTFGELGVKQAIFKCLSCQTESAFTQDPK
jgi:DNA-binding MarR family transcriptional regulator